MAVILVLAAVVVAFPSCRKLEAPPANAKLSQETLANATTLPSEWGSLVSVTNVAAYPDLQQLWFQDHDGNLRIVVYRAVPGEFLHVTLVRRQ